MGMINIPGLSDALKNVEDLPDILNSIDTSLKRVIELLEEANDQREGTR